MDYKLNPHYLRKEMMSHELRVRGIKLSESATKDEMRASLRSLLKIEQTIGACSYPPCDLDFESECERISAYLAEAKSVVGTISGAGARFKVYSIQARLMHLHGRITRLLVDDLTAEQQRIRSEYLVDVLATLDSLDGVVRGNPDLSRQLQGASDVDPPPDDMSREHVCSSRIETPVASAVHVVAQPQSMSVFKPQSLDKWNVKFSGDSKLITVHNFLERVAELRAARGVTEEQLFSSAVDLFTGKALVWFRANRHRFDDWKGLTGLLRRHFEPPDYRPRLFKEILERTQDTSESIVEYLSCMQALFARYGGLDETVQLDILVRNLAPFYSTQLSEVSSITDLEEECLKLETKKFRCDNYVPPSRRRQRFVEPDFAFVAEEPSHVARVCDQGVEIDSMERQPRRRETVPIQCWNCGKDGHIARVCRSRRTSFRGFPASARARDGGNGYDRMHGESPENESRGSQ